MAEAPVGHGEKQSRKAETLIAALLAAPSVSAAAAMAGLDEKTVRSWLRNPKFAVRFQAAKADVVKVVAGKLAGSMTAAADRLRALLDSSDEKTQLAAARAILESGPRLLESEGLAAKVAELESLLLELQARAKPQR
jgi:hypothetical protein